jgi:hypothetical protein
MNRLNRLVLAAMLFPSLASAQQICVNGMRLEGTITDPTGAVIRGAQVQAAANGEKALTDATGHYVLPCIPATSTTITAQADGFTTGTAPARIRLGATSHVNLQLAVASVQTDVQVNGDRISVDADQGIGTIILNTHLDMNLSRSFTLNPKDKDRPRTLTFNARSANLLNHTNVTAVNTIVSSGSLGQPLTAEPARRVELGIRFAF